MSGRVTGIAGNSELTYGWIPLYLRFFIGKSKPALFLPPIILIDIDEKINYIKDSAAYHNLYDAKYPLIAPHELF